MYSAGYSDFNLPLSVELKTFFVVLFFASVCMLFGFKNWFGEAENKLGLGKISVRNLRLFSILFLLSGFAETIYSKGSPLLGRSAYKDYGIPTIHVIIVSGASFFVLYLFQLFLQKTYSKPSIVLDILFTMVPLTLGLSRGTIVILAISMTILFLNQTCFKLKRKYLLVIIISAIFGMYLFGIFGNYRMNHDYKYSERVDESSLILNIGKANQKFYQSNIPTPYFWTYIYVTSPLANLSTTTELVNSKLDVSDKNLFDFVIINFVPDFISKRVVPDWNKLIVARRVTPEFTASSVFSIPYLMLGWSGMYITLIFIIIFPLVYFYFIKRFASRFFGISFALVSSMYVLMPFANFFTFSALSVQLIFPFLCNIRLTNKMERRLN